MKNSSSPLPILNQYLIEHRVKLKLEDTEFAKLLGIGFEHLRKIEAGKYPVSINIINRITELKGKNDCIPITPPANNYPEPEESKNYIYATNNPVLFLIQKSNENKANLYTHKINRGKRIRKNIRRKKDPNQLSLMLKDTNISTEKNPINYSNNDNNFNTKSYVNKNFILEKINQELNFFNKIYFQGIESFQKNRFGLDDSLPFYHNMKNIKDEFVNKLSIISNSIVNNEGSFVEVLLLLNNTSNNYCQNLLGKINNSIKEDTPLEDNSIMVASK